MFVYVDFTMRTGSIFLQLKDGPPREDTDLAAVFTGLSLSLSSMSHSFKVAYLVISIQYLMGAVATRKPSVG